MKPHRQDIVFFERNGLQHGEFPLIEGAGLVREVCWNNDSSVLAILLRTEEGSQETSPTTRGELSEPAPTASLWDRFAKIYILTLIILSAGFTCYPSPVSRPVFPSFCSIGEKMVWGRGYMLSLP